MITIITVTKDNRSELFRTLDSFMLQGCKEFEIIVVNGGGELDLSGYWDSGIKLRVVRDDGGGIYAAMNIGLDCVDTDQVLFINAGDELADEGVIESLKTLEEKQKIIIGGTAVIGRRWEWRLGTKIPCHNSMVFPKSPIRYDTSLKVFADGKFIDENNAEFQSVKTETYISRFHLGGVSNRDSWRLVAANFKEKGMLAGLRSFIRAGLTYWLGERARYIIYLLKGVRGSSIAEFYQS